MKYVCALIAVADVARSRELYETLRGQRVPRFYDYDRHLVEIGEALEPASGA